MAVTRIFKNGNSQAVRIRPARRSLDGALAKFGQFSDDFMTAGRGTNIEAEREDL